MEWQLTAAAAAEALLPLTYSMVQSPS